MTATPIPPEDAGTSETPESDAPTVAPVDTTHGPSLSTVEWQLAELVRLSEARERTIDRLHEEVQRLRAGELQQTIAPLLRDLLSLHDDLAEAVQQHTTAPREPGSSADVAADDLAIFRDMVGDMLYRFGVEAIAAAPGDVLNLKDHRVVETSVTHDPTADRTIMAVLRTGYRNESRVVRPADVRVFRHRAEDGAAS